MIKNENNNSKSVIENWQKVNTQVAMAGEQANRPEADVNRYLLFQKAKPAEMVATLAEQARQCHFGENYLQEAIEKINSLKANTDCEDIVWHYIGSIQRNKTRDIAENFDWVQTVERDIIAKRLNNQRPEALPPLNVLIQVNIDNEDSKSGCLSAELPELISTIKGYKRLQLRGLMIIPAKSDTNAFAEPNNYLRTSKGAHPELSKWDTLSMGMSGDMVEAIAEG